MLDVHLFANPISRSAQARHGHVPPCALPSAMGSRSALEGQLALGQPDFQTRSHSHTRAHQSLAGNATLVACGWAKGGSQEAGGQTQKAPESCGPPTGSWHSSQAQRRRTTRDIALTETPNRRAGYSANSGSLADDCFSGRRPCYDAGDQCPVHTTPRCFPGLGTRSVRPPQCHGMLSPTHHHTSAAGHSRATTVQRANQIGRCSEVRLEAYAMIHTTERSVKATAPTQRLRGEAGNEEKEEENDHLYRR